MAGCFSRSHEHWKARTAQCIQSGPTPYAKRHVHKSSASAWRLQIDEGILKLIQKCTEIEARSKLNDMSWSVTLEELDAFIRISYIHGVLGAHNINRRELWSMKWEILLIQMAMSRNRFEEIFRFLRFDIKSFRSERLKFDKFALILDVWNKFISNGQACYVPGPYITVDYTTVDEQLFPSKARCRFLQFMASKPDKYGQKFWLAVDKDSKYIINGFPYFGKNDARSNDQRFGDYVVQKLMAPFLGKGCNVTCDNFFTSLQLAEYLKSKATSLVGTVNRSRREIPSSVKTAQMPLYETRVLKTDDITLTVY